MALTFKDLLRIFGKVSDFAKHLVPQLYQLCEAEGAHLGILAPKEVQALTTVYPFGKNNPAALFCAVKAYYAIVVTWLAAYRFAIPSSQSAVADSSHFRSYGITNFNESEIERWYQKITLPLDSLYEILSRFDYTNPPPDALKALYHDLFPRKLRHALGEYYTPDWLAEHVLESLAYQGQGRLLDPTCGSGTFLIHALRRLQAIGQSKPLESLAGIDVNPLACLAAKANLLLNLVLPLEEIHLPIYEADILFHEHELGHFDVVVGNPPWVNWETLTKDYRAKTIPLWQKYELFPHKGYDTILGSGKKDLAHLITVAVLDRHVKEGGKLGFIMAQSVLKSANSGAAFRRLILNQLLHVDDLHQLNVFADANTRPAVLILQKGMEAQKTISYRLWQSQSKSKIKIEDSLQMVYQKSQVQDLAARSIPELDFACATGEAHALEALVALLGQSDYQAHAGAYTGGANAVYWLDIVQNDGETLWVRNHMDGAKHKVKQAEVQIEAALVYPLLKGIDVKRWRAIPSLYILMVQNPKTKRGYPEDWLEQHYPLTYTYLKQFEDMLRERAMFKRFFKKADDPFYSMFDIADYSFAPFKVVWVGYGTDKMKASVLEQVNGKSIMTNQAMHPMIGLTNREEAHYVAACLNSLPFEYAIVSHSVLKGKSFAQSGILQRLRIPPYEADNPIHQGLRRLSEFAHTQPHEHQTIQQALTPLSAQLWGLAEHQIESMGRSLAMLRNES